MHALQFMSTVKCYRHIINIYLKLAFVTIAALYIRFLMTTKITCKNIPVVAKVSNQRLTWACIAHLLIHTEVVNKVQCSLDFKKQYSILNFTYGPAIIMFNCNLLRWNSYLKYNGWFVFSFSPKYKQNVYLRQQKLEQICWSTSFKKCSKEFNEKYCKHTRNYSTSILVVHPIKLAPYAKLCIKCHQKYTEKH